MAHTWKRDRAAEHIEKKIKDVKNVEIIDWKRDLSLENIPVNKAYRVDGVHLYVEITNLTELLGTTEKEGESCHKRALRFLNQYYRAVDRILSKCSTRRVDFHNQRLHALVVKPYGDDEAGRIHRAIAIAQLIIDVLKETNDDDEHIPNAKVRVGIDSGVALAVNNGRNKGREPLFLGPPANLAAKLASGATKTGIFLSNGARDAIGLDEVNDAKSVALTPDEVQSSHEEAALDVSSDKIVNEWRDDLKKNPIGKFEFSRHTPPLRTLDISTLTPGNSRRQEAVSMYADLDGFTKFVGDHIDDNAEDVVRVLHVIRAELDRVLSSDFDGRRIRHIGDCIHGLLCDGTAQTTDEKETVSTATLCAGAIRSSFELALEKLEDEGIETAGLGLQVGFELGPMTVTRLGLQGDRVRCSVSRGVLRSEAEQGRCNADETAIGLDAFNSGTDAVRKLFGPKRKTAGLDYNEAVEGLSAANDDTAKASKAAAFAPATPAVQRSSTVEIKPYAKRR